jgi:hypothetical protein
MKHLFRFGERLRWQDFSPRSGRPNLRQSFIKRRHPARVKDALKEESRNQQNAGKLDGTLQPD